MRAFAASAAAPPWPAGQSHPARDEAAERAHLWADTHGLAPTPSARRRLGGADAAGLTARVCPDVSGAGLFLLTDLVTWLFALDDTCDSGALGTDPARLTVVVDELTAVLDRQGAGAPHGTPTQLALHDLCRRIAGSGQPAMLRRFTALLRRYLWALVWEAANRARHQVPDVPDYIRMRRHTGAVLPCFVVTDLAERVAPAPGPRPGRVDLRRVDLRRARLDLLAADLVCWCNDLFSYARERDGHNLAAVIAHRHGFDDPAALTAAAGLFADRLDEYQRLEADLLRDAGPALHRVLASRRRWIRATYDWSVHAPRYA